MEGEPYTGGEREPTPSEGNRPENSRDAQGQVPTPETPEHMLLSTVGESGESTAEDWQTSYQKYLEDSPISQGTPTFGRGSSSKQPETKSQKKKDKVDQHLQAMQRKAEHMVAIRRKADDFFRRNRSPLEKPPLQSSGDQKPAAEGTIQWVRLMNFESVLLQPDYLFHFLGATTPSIEATTMAELVRVNMNWQRSVVRRSGCGKHVNGPPCSSPPAG